jgi:hypothetical protein
MVARVLNANAFGKQQVGQHTSADHGEAHCVSD